MEKLFFRKEKIEQISKTTGKLGYQRQDITGTNFKSFQTRGQKKIIHQTASLTCGQNAKMQNAFESTLMPRPFSSVASDSQSLMVVVYMIPVCPRYLPCQPKKPNYFCLKRPKLPTYGYGNGIKPGRDGEYQIPVENMLLSAVLSSGLHRGKVTFWSKTSLHFT